MFLQSPSYELLDFLEQRSSWDKNDFDKRFFYAFKLLNEATVIPLKFKLENLIKENPHRSLIIATAILKSKEIPTNLKYKLAWELAYRDDDIWYKFHSKNKKNKELYINTIRDVFNSNIFMNTDIETYMGYVLMKNGDTTPIETLTDFVQSYSYWNKLETTIKALKFAEKNKKVIETLANLRKKMGRIKNILDQRKRDTQRGSTRVSEPSLLTQRVLEK